MGRREYPRKFGNEIFSEENRFLANLWVLNQKSKKDAVWGIEMVIWNAEREMENFELFRDKFYISESSGKRERVREYVAFSNSHFGFAMSVHFPAGTQGYFCLSVQFGGGMNGIFSHIQLGQTR